MTKIMYTKEEHEKLLLAHIDIPYFRNNPTYIEMWRAYFQQHRDPQILLLMFHKEISTLYHWIHIELSQHFIKKNHPQIAHFILSEALRNNVYDSQRIKEALERIPPFEKKYSKGDMLALLNTRNISALGRVWNCLHEVFFYSTTPPKDEATYEILKMKNYECKYPSLVDGKELITWLQSKGINRHPLKPSLEDLSLESIDNEKQLRLARNTEEVDRKAKSKIDLEKANSSELDAAMNCIKANSNDYQLGSETESKMFSEINTGVQPPTEECMIYSSSFICAPENEEDGGNEHKRAKIDCNENSDEDVVVISGSMELNGEITFGQYIYLIQSIDNSGVGLLRIARDEDITQTMIGKTFVLKRCTRSCAEVYRDIYGFDVCRHFSDYFVLYEYNKLCDLTPVIRSGSSAVQLFYLKKVMEKLLVLKEKGYTLRDPLGFFINQNFDLGFDSVELCAFNESSLEAMISVIKEVFGLIDNEISMDHAVVAKMGAQLDTTAMRKELLKHKADILQSI